MKLASGKEFELRCDMLALRDAKRESGVDIQELGEDVVQLGTLAFYMARSSANFRGVEFAHDLDSFLSLITWADMETLTAAVVSSLGAEAQKKKQ